MPPRIVWQGPVGPKQRLARLKICHHDDAPVEGLCSDCGMVCYADLPRGGVRYYEPAPDPRLETMKPKEPKKP